MINNEQARRYWAVQAYAIEDEDYRYCCECGACTEGTRELTNRDKAQAELFHARAALCIGNYDGVVRCIADAAEYYTDAVREGE